MPTNIPSFLEIQDMFSQIFAKLFFRKIQIFIDFFFCLCRGAAVTTGLAFAHRFVRYAVVDFLITYFTDHCKYNLVDAVALVNLLEGSSSFLVLAMTYISNEHVSRRKVILCATAAYIIGMVMFCFSYYHPIHDHDKIGRYKIEMYFYFVPAVLLISVGKAGGLPILEEFLVDQLTAHEPKPDTDEGRVNARKTVWWTFSYLSAFLPPLIFRNANWDVLFISSTSVMGIGYLLFLCCKPLYHGSMNEATTTEIPHASPEENIPVDEATTAEISPASPEEKINNGLVFFAISLVKQWKPLSVMIPMWTTFLVFGLVLSARDTFFTDQTNVDTPTSSIYVLLMIRNIIRVMPSTFEFIKRFTAFPSKISSNISTLLSKFIPKLETQGLIVTIWTAMVISVFCCSVAWSVAEDPLSWSIMRLAPQFCLLALMEGIGKQGLDLFFMVQVSDVPMKKYGSAMKKYGSALNEAVIGLGSFLNGLLVFLFRSWFRDTSRLDKYYHMLTVVSFVNMCYYWWVSTFYSKRSL